ncbi:MAG: GAF domain-containing protein [Anaerolineae bacterium]
MEKERKEEVYQRVKDQIKATLEGETDLIASMATIACLLHHSFDYLSWTGFYLVVAPGELLIGPYQGTLGCLHISFDRGVCGAAARREETIIVPDVHQFPGHIACDPNSKSEIVVPVFNERDELIAVLDVDSAEYDAFGEVDKRHLEEIVTLLRDKR